MRVPRLQLCLVGYDSFTANRPGMWNLLKVCCLKDFILTLPHGVVSLSLKCIVAAGEGIQFNTNLQHNTRDFHDFLPEVSYIERF
jgi:hypothetical protein